MTWQKNKTTTLDNPSNLIQVTALEQFDFNDVLCHLINVGFIDGRMRLQLNSNNDYATRRETNGANDFTRSADVYLTILAGDSSDSLTISDITNINQNAKLLISIAIRNNSFGAGNVPSRIQFVGKMDTSTVAGQFTDILVVDIQTGQYLQNSNLSVLSTE